MSYNVINMWVDPSMYTYKCPFTMEPVGVCVHNTYNKASARNEATNMKKSSNKRYVSFHDVVDNIEVVRCIPYSRNAFHAGDGRYGTGNRKYIGVEICYSKYGGPKFDQAEINAAKHIAGILKTYGWGIEHVKRHYDFSGKYCPHRTMDYGWQRFLNMISAALNDGTVQDTANKLVVDGDWGKATTRAGQKWLDTPVDGIVSKQPKSNKKYLPNCYPASWSFVTLYYGGSTFVKALQKKLKAKKYYKGSIDGYFGKQSAIAFQKYLKALKYYTGEIDGIIGIKSVKAWQKFLNAKL